MKIGDALVYLATEASGLKQGFDAAKAQTQSWANNLGSMAKTALTGVVIGAATAAAAAVLSVGAAAMDVSVQTQQASADIAASLGLPIEEARKFGEVAKQVYGNNFADSVTDAGDAVAIVAKQLELAADNPALKTMTENAFRLRDVFGVDVNESIDAVKTLMTNFGLSSEEAFDLLASGYQKGLDRSGDFLDTIGEYSVQFAAGGASAGEFFSLLDSGLQGGMLGTDKAADAFKEFRVRIADGSQTTADALAQIGINVDDLTAGMASGTISAADAFGIVQAALNATEDPVVRMQAGVGLMGTQFEDLGDKTALALSMTEDWAAGSEGAINTLDAKYNTFGSAVEGIWRRLVVSVSPFTDKLLELVNEAMPAVMGAFDRFDATVGPAMQTAQTVVGNVVNFIKTALAGFATSVDDDAVAPVSYWKQWLDTNLPLVQTLITNILGGIQSFWATWGDAIMTVVTFVFGTIGTMIATTMQTIGDTITLALQLLTGDWEGAWETFKGIVERIWTNIGGIFGTAIEGLKTSLSSVDWAAAGQAIATGLWDGIVGAWEWAVAEPFRRKLDALRALLPFSEPKDPRSPLRGLRKAGEATVGMIREGMDAEMERLTSGFSGGLASLVGGGGSAAASVTNGPISIVINLSGPATYEMGREMGRGVKDELRQRGLG